MDSEMYARACGVIGRVQVAPDREELRAYVKRRMKEGELSYNKFAEALGRPVGGIRAQMQPSIAVSYEQLEKWLWIVDGDDCPYAYGQIKAAEPPHEMTTDQFFEAYPEGEIDDNLRDEWLISCGNKELRYKKEIYSLRQALYDANEELKGYDIWKP